MASVASYIWGSNAAFGGCRQIPEAKCERESLPLLLLFWEELVGLLERGLEAFECFLHLTEALPDLLEGLAGLVHDPAVLEEDVVAVEEVVVDVAAVAVAAAVVVAVVAAVAVAAVAVVAYLGRARLQDELFYSLQFVLRKAAVGTGRLILVEPLRRRLRAVWAGRLGRRIHEQLVVWAGRLGRCVSGRPRSELVLSR